MSKYARLLKVLFFLTAIMGILPFELKSESTSTHTANLVPSRIEREYRNALTALYSFDFEAAGNLINLMLDKYPRHYLPHFAKTNLVWWKTLTLPYNESIENDFYTTARNTLSMIPNPALDEEIFYYINVYAMIARMDAKNGQMIKAYRSGRQCLKQIEESLNRVTIFEGFLLTSGIYNYMTVYAGRKNPIFRLYSLLYPSGDAAKGVAMLQKATESSDLLLKTESHYFLLRIFLDMEENPAKAEKHGRWLTETFPDNLIFQYYYLQSLKQLAVPETFRKHLNQVRNRLSGQKGIDYEQRRCFQELFHTL